MNKKYLLLVVTFITLLVLVSFWFLKRDKGSIVTFSELKMQEGAIESIDGKKIVIKKEKYVMNPENQEENKIEEFISLTLSDDISVLEESAGIKSEEVFRKQENDFLEWAKKNESEKNISNFQFSPSWRETAEIKKSSLEKDDMIDVIYRLEDDKMIALKIYKKFINKTTEGNIQEMSNLKYNVVAEILETEEQKMSVKLLSDINEKYLTNTVLDLFVDDETIMQQLEKKSEEVFAVEQKEFDVERLRINNEGGDILKLQAPAWFKEEKITKDDLNVGDEVNLEIVFNGDDFLVKKVQKIIR